MILNNCLSASQSVTTSICLWLLRVYQKVISPVFLFLGVQCRFNPSCSEFSYQAIQKKGIVRGLYLSLCRVGRCHPWNDGGNDPVDSY